VGLNLHANVRLRWNCLLVTNTLVYYSKALVFLERRCTSRVGSNFTLKYWTKAELSISVKTLVYYMIA